MTGETDAVPSDQVACMACGRVSFAVTETLARRWSGEARGAHLMRRPAQPGRAPAFARANYDCMGCGGRSFRPAMPGDCPEGCTIGPVICEEYATKERAR